jgi:hypothetical protein
MADNLNIIINTLTAVNRSNITDYVLFIRSNSEERPLEESSGNCKDSIRRVSSHEDFSLVKVCSKNNNNINKTNSGRSFLTELIDPAVVHGVVSLSFA